LVNRLFAASLAVTLLAVSACSEAPAVRVMALLEKLHDGGGAVGTHLVSLSGCQLDISTSRALPEDGQIGGGLTQSATRFDLTLYNLRKAGFRKLPSDVNQLEFQQRPVSAAMLDQAETFLAGAPLGGAAAQIDRKAIRKLRAQPNGRLTTQLMIMMPQDGSTPPLHEDGPAFHHYFERLRDVPAPFSIAMTAVWISSDKRPSPETLLTGSTMFPSPMAFRMQSEEDAKALFDALAEHSAAECPAALR
jgi:hypothetical protein